MTGFLTLLRRELALALRDGAAAGTALGFYIVVVALLPLGLGPDLALLGRIAPGVLWIALLLAALLSLPRMFETDMEDGSLDALALGEMPLELVAAAKALAHWLTTGVPLTLAAPVLGLLLNLDLAAYPSLLASMAIGAPAVSFFGGIGAALTLKSRRGGLLLALLILPFFIPTLIFGIAAIHGATAAVGHEGQSSFLLLTAVTLASLVLGPLATAFVLRLQMA